MTDPDKIVTAAKLTKLAIDAYKQWRTKRGEKGPPPADKAVVRNLIIFLEDRRVLFDLLSYEDPNHVKKSVFEIRQELTASMRALGEGSLAIPFLRSMQYACRTYLDGSPWQKALAEFRQQFHDDLKHLSIIYDIPSTLPNRIRGSMYGPLGRYVSTIYVPPPSRLGAIAKTRKPTKKGTIGKPQASGSKRRSGRKRT